MWNTEAIPRNFRKNILQKHKAIKLKIIQMYFMQKDMFLWVCTCSICYKWL